MTATLDNVSKLIAQIKAQLDNLAADTLDAYICAASEGADTDDLVSTLHYIDMATDSITEATTSIDNILNPQTV